MKSILHKLVSSFSHPGGVPSDTAEAVILLTSDLLGDDAARIFATHLEEAGDGRLKPTEDVDKLWKKMLKASSHDTE